MSVQWKAYCFKHEEERRMWLEHSDDISPRAAYERLVSEVVQRGKATGKESVMELAAKICREFIRVPDELQQTHGAPAQPAAASKL